MTDQPTYLSLLGAVERYFDLMFDSDVSQFDQVFASSALLHGLRDDNLRVLPCQEYKVMLAAGPSPSIEKCSTPSGDSTR